MIELCNPIDGGCARFLGGIGAGAGTVGTSGGGTGKAVKTTRIDPGFPRGVGPARAGAFLDGIYYGFADPSAPSRRIFEDGAKAGRGVGSASHGGDDDYLLKVHYSDTAHLEHFLTNMLTTVAGM